MRKNDLSGQQYGRLTVVRYYDKNNHKDIRWECKCLCGNTVVVFGGNLRRGHSRSCGCIEKDRPNATIHGLKNHPLYKVWKGIKSRCYCKNMNIYKWYGGRGVYVCDEWKDNPSAFIG